MNKLEDDFNIDDVRDILQRVKYREKQFTNEVELLERQLNGQDIKGLAKASLSIDEAERFASLVNKRVQESKSQIKENVNQLMKSKIRTPTVKRSTVSRLTQPKKTSCERCQNESKSKREEPPHSGRNVSNQTAKPRLRHSTQSLSYVPNIMFNRRQRSMPITTQDILQENIVLLGVVQTRQHRVKTDSKETNTSVTMEQRSNVAIQTVNDEGKRKSTNNAGIQAVEKPNFKLIEIKPTKRCDIQVLPSINIPPPPSTNVQYTEMVDQNRTNIVNSQHLVSELYSELSEEDVKMSGTKSKSSKVSPEADIKVEVNAEKFNVLNTTEILPQTPPVEDRCWTGASNPEDETLASQMSLVSYENHPLTPNRPSSAPEALFASTIRIHSPLTHEAAVQTSDFSQPSLSHTHSSSCSDFTQLSLGQVQITPELKNETNSYDDGVISSFGCLSEGEVLPLASHKPTVKFKQPDDHSINESSTCQTYTVSPGLSLGQVIS